MSVTRAFLARKDKEDEDAFLANPVAKLIVAEEERLGTNWIPWYHRAPSTIHFLYEFQTALLILVGKMKIKGRHHLPPPIAPRFTAKSFEHIAKIEDIVDACRRHTAHPTEEFIYETNDQVKTKYLVFANDHNTAYRTAVISANVSGVSSHEADPLDFDQNYNVLGANGLKLAVELLQNCMACTGADGTPDETECRKTVHHLYENVYKQRVRGHVLVQGFVARSHADAVLLPALPYGDMCKKIRTAQQVVDSRALFIDSLQWRVFPRLRYVLMGSIRANVVAMGRKGPVLVKRRKLLKEIVNELRLHALHERWVVPFSSCVDEYGDTTDDDDPTEDDDPTDEDDSGDRRRDDCGSQKRFMDHDDSDFWSRGDSSPNRKRLRSDDDDSTEDGDPGHWDASFSSSGLRSPSEASAAEVWHALPIELHRHTTHWHMFPGPR